jgi:HSP20 family protein
MALARRSWDDLPELDRPFFELFRPFAFPWWKPRFAFTPEMPYMPAVDMFARNVDMIVRVELPGIDPAKDVKVTLEEGVLDVKGERKQEKEVKEEGYYRKESVYGAFERRIPVPAAVKESDIKADYKDGVLEVVVTGAAKNIPKATAREIPIHKKEALPAKS